MSIHDHDPLCRPPRMFTQHGCADCNLIREVRQDERAVVIDLVIGAVLLETMNSDSIAVKDVIQQLEAIADTPPADPAEGTGSAGRGQEAS